MYSALCAEAGCHRTSETLALQGVPADLDGGQAPIPPRCIYMYFGQIFPPFLAKGPVSPPNSAEFADFSAALPIRHNLPICCLLYCIAVLIRYYG